MSKQSSAQKIVDLPSAMAAIEQQFGAGALVTLAAAGETRHEAIPTGALSLDIALGIGGVPRGRIVEIYGPESSGKTTLTYHLIAEAQRAGGRCAFVDAEHSMDPTYAAAIGVDTDALLVSQPDCGEQGLEIANILARSGEVALLVVDSVAALVPQAELDGNIGDTTVGLQARMMGQALRRLAGNLREHNATCVFTNQLRERIGVVYGPKETQPGGRALKFYASQRLDIRRIETFRDGEQAVGNRVRVRIVKNKVAPPFREAEFDIHFGEGICAAGCVLDLAVEHGIVRRRGAIYSYGEERLGNGRAKTTAALRERPELLAALGEKLHELANADAGAAEPVAHGDEDKDGAAHLELAQTGKDAKPQLAAV